MTEVLVHGKWSADPNLTALGDFGPYHHDVTEPIRVSRATARRYLVLHHLLAPPRSLPPGEDGVRCVFQRLGSLQFDPLEVAGRNHDLVLLARVAGYRRDVTERLLYAEREVYETYNKSLSLVPTAELPWYRLTWDQAHEEHRGGAFDEHQPLVEELLERIRANGPMSATDVEPRAAIDWYWRPTNQVRAILEALAEAGILGLARRDGNRRVYDLAERLFPADLLAERRPHDEQGRHRLLSRYRAHGLLGTGGPAELWIGAGRAADRAERRAELVATGALVEVVVDGLRGSRFVPAGEVERLEMAAVETGRDGLAPDAEDPWQVGRPGGTAPGVAFLAPLDPLVWDRDLLRRLFGFDYIWEVYVPQAKRRWGYYVLPILYGDSLVGRIEPRIDRRDGALRIVGLWFEDGFEPLAAPGFVAAFADALRAHAAFADLDRVILPRIVRHRPVVGAVSKLLGRGGRVRG
jgi:uncharacterized protein